MNTEVEALKKTVEDLSLTVGNLIVERNLLQVKLEQANYKIAELERGELSVQSESEVSSV